MKPPGMIFPKGKRRLVAWLQGILAIVMMMATGCNPPGPPPAPPTAHNLNYRMCISMAGAPGESGIPVINGSVAEMGWFGAMRFIGKYNGATSPVANAAIQAKRDNTNLYISVEVSGDPTLDSSDLIILAFDPDGNNANVQRLHIAPLTTGLSGSASNQSVPPNQIKYWKGSPFGANIALPAGLDPANDIKVEYATSSSPNSNRWSVEMALPLADLGIVPTNYFGFYANVVVANVSTGVAQQFPWPSTGANLTGGDTGPWLPENNTPDKNTWGNATTGNAVCNGVSLTSSDIQTNHTPSTKISLDEGNIFTARPRNDSVDAAGAPKAVSNITATFRIRNIGISSLGTYAPVPVGSPAGVTAPGNIAASSQGTLSLPVWNLNPTQVSQYTANPNQCIGVDLNSSSPDTIFTTRSAYNNFHFQETASPFDGKFSVAAPQEGRGPVEFILTERYYNTPFDEPWASTLEGAEPIGEGVYRLTVDPGAEAEVRFTATPPKAVKIPGGIYRLEKLFLAPASREIVALDVEPGSLVTLIGSGTLDLRREGPLSGPTGPIGRNLPKPESDEYLLPKEHSPEQLIGAAIVSFDSDFREGPFFVVGQAVSFKMPRDRSQIFLAINDSPEGYRQHKGDGYTVQAFITPLEDYFVFTDPIIARDPTLENFTFPAGVNLPKYNVCGQMVTDRVITLDGKDFKLVQDAGCYEAVLTAIR